MKIVKCTLREYLERYTNLLDEEIDEWCESIKDDFDLDYHINNCYHHSLWNYHPYDLEELIKKEEDWKEESQCETFEDTYVYLFGRLWEVEQ